VALTPAVGQGYFAPAFQAYSTWQPDRHGLEIGSKGILPLCPIPAASTVHLPLSR
jgi:hypothetical protein